MVVSGILLIACNKEPDEPTIDYDHSQQGINVTVSVGASNVKVLLSSKAEEVGNATVKVVAMKANEYLAADGTKGLSANTSKGTEVGEYTLGTDATLTVGRYNKGYDNLYNKYYVVDENGTVLKGPVYATQITSSDAKPTFGASSKKGVVGGSADVVKDLEASNVTMKFDLSSMLFASDEDLSAAQLANAIQFTANDTTLYFKKNVVQSYDAQVRAYYAAGARVIAVVNTVEVDTAFAEGLNNCVAVMEFLASRYTTTDKSGNFVNGFVSTFVIGSAADRADGFNADREQNATLDEYMEEYSRMLRLCNLAVKKYHAAVSVAMPLSNAWATAASEASYAPKAMIDWLSNKTSAEGNFDWGIAPSIYGKDVSVAQVFEYDTDASIENKGLTADFNTSATLSISNVELLDQYLNQEALKLGDKTRSVYVTEYGVSGNGSNGESVQAGVLAATWYKVSQLDSIVCYNYDMSGDFALVSGNGAHKAAYVLYKFVDTQYTSTIAAPYLSAVRYYKGTELTTPTSYMELLNTLGTTYDFTNFDWNKAAAREIVPPIYDWENVKEMEGNYALDGSFVADGFEHTITVVTRQGVTVKYSVNGGELTETKPTRTQAGEKPDVILVHFYDGETLLGIRQVKLTVDASVETNKSIYNNGEKIFVNVQHKQSDNLTSRAWVGLVAAEEWHNGQFVRDNVGLVASVGVFKSGNYTRTFTIDATVAAGEYYVVFSRSADFDQVGEAFKIRVLASGESSGLADLSGITFADASFDVLEGQEDAMSLEIEGATPDGVSVEYVNNGKTAKGTYNVCAVFKKDGKVIEKRYAIMTLVLVEDKLALEKTTFAYGEAILVTAISDVTKTERTLKVGLFDKESGTLIAFYFVKDTANGYMSGRTYNILDRSALQNTGSLFTTVGAFQFLNVGEYEIRLYQDGQADAIDSVDVTVEEALTLTMDKTDFELDEDVLATAKGISAGGTPLFNGALKVALFSKNDPDPFTNPFPVVPVFAYEVDASTSGKQLALQQFATARPFDNKLPDGEYVVYLLIDTNATTYQLAKYDVTVGDTSVELVPITFINGEDEGGVRKFSYDEDVQVKIDLRTVSPLSDMAWVEFSPLIDGKAWLYVKDVCDVNGNWTIDRSILPAGESYHLKLYYDYGSVVVAETDFTVEALPADTLQLLNATTSFTLGDTLQVKVDPTYLSGDTWLAIYPDYWKVAYEENRKFVTSVKVSDLAESDYVWTVDLVGNVQHGVNHVVLFKSMDSYVEAVDPITFTVEHNGNTAKAPTILGDKTTFQGGETVPIKFDTDDLENVFIFTWISIYFAHDVTYSIYLEYVYLTKLVDNDYVWYLDTYGYPTGEYTVVFMVDYNGTIHSEKANFTIENGEEFMSIVGGQTEFELTDTIYVHYVEPKKFLKQDEGAWIGIWTKSSWTGSQSGYLAPWIYCRDYMHANWNPSEIVTENTWAFAANRLAPGDYVFVLCAKGENVAVVEFTIKAPTADTTVATSVDYFVDTNKRSLEA